LFFFYSIRLSSFSDSFNDYNSQSIFVSSCWWYSKVSGA